MISAARSAAVSRAYVCMYVSRAWCPASRALAALRGRLGPSRIPVPAGGAPAAGAAPTPPAAARGVLARADDDDDCGRDAGSCGGAAAISSLPSAACGAKLQSICRLCSAARTTLLSLPAWSAVCGRGGASGTTASSANSLAWVELCRRCVVGAAVCGRACSLLLVGLVVAVGWRLSRRSGLAGAGFVMSLTRMMSRVADLGRGSGP